jgi:hypothetical protein
MMSSGITDVIILPNDATATFFRITIVSQTMTFAQIANSSSFYILVIFINETHQSDSNLAGDHVSGEEPRNARFSTLAWQVYIMRTERAVPQRTIKSIEFGFALFPNSFLSFLA